MVIIFFIVIPGLIGGFGNYFYPLLISTFDLILPRLNAFTYWVLPWALIFILVSLGIDLGCGTGWTFYPPLRIDGQLGKAPDFVIFGLHISGISSVARRVNFTGTGQEIRAPGITWLLLSLFIWCLLVTVFLLILSLPVLARGITITLTDRNLNTTFFNRNSGGNILIFQHLFWFFGHPEVYVLIAPAFGLVSLACLTLNGRGAVKGGKGIFVAIFSIGFIGCLV